VLLLVKRTPDDDEDDEEQHVQRCVCPFHVPSPSPEVELLVKRQVCVWLGEGVQYYLVVAENQSVSNLS
jgi:hypothetical protein